jgi:hypothetical protein
MSFFIALKFPYVNTILFPLHIYASLCLKGLHQAQIQIISLKLRYTVANPFGRQLSVVYKNTKAVRRFFVAKLTVHCRHFYCETRTACFYCIPLPYPLPLLYKQPAVKFKPFYFHYFTPSRLLAFFKLEPFTLTNRDQSANVHLPNKDDTESNASTLASCWPPYWLNKSRYQFQRLKRLFFWTRRPSFFLFEPSRSDLRLPWLK